MVSVSGIWAGILCKLCKKEIFTMVYVFSYHGLSSKNTASFYRISATIRQL